MTLMLMNITEPHSSPRKITILKIFSVTAVHLIRIVWWVFRTIQLRKALFKIDKIGGIRNFDMSIT